MSALNEELAELSGRWYPKLGVLKDVLEDRNERAQCISPKVSAQTDYTFVMIGWVPKKQLANTKNSLKKAFEGRVIVNDLDVSREESYNAPTCYDNPRIVKPFETLSNLVGTPLARRD